MNCTKMTKRETPKGSIDPLGKKTIPKTNTAEKLNTMYKIIRFLHGLGDFRTMTKGHKLLDREVKSINEDIDTFFRR